MIILVHRGWGLLTLLIAVLTIPSGIWLGDQLTRDGSNPLTTATGLLLCGIVLTLLGVWLNQMRAAELSRRYAAQRRQQLDDLVQSGHFNLGHPWPIPTSMAMAQSQADQLLAAETDAYAKAQHNRHTFFWIPMQFWGYAALAGAVVLGITALFE